MWLIEHEIDLQTENLYKRRRPVVTIQARWFLITVIVLWVWYTSFELTYLVDFFSCLHSTVDSLFFYNQTW